MGIRSHRVAAFVTQQMVGLWETTRLGSRLNSQHWLFMSGGIHMLPTAERANSMRRLNFLTDALLADAGTETPTG